MTKPQLFKKLVQEKKSLLTPVAHDPLTAKIAEKLGFEAVSMGGFAVSGVVYGLPDMGLIGLSEMVQALTNITRSTNLPVFADADGGYGNERNVAFTVREYERAGVASLFIEDQKHPKKCGHTSNKELVTVEEMVSKIKAAVGARGDPDLLICARTDAIAPEGFESAIVRAREYVKAGADIIFVEAPEDLDQLIAIPKLITEVPLLVNMLEGGKTPICSQGDLEQMGYKIIAYPISTLMASVKAVEEVLSVLKNQGDSRTFTNKLMNFSDYKT